MFVIELMDWLLFTKEMDNICLVTSCSVVYKQSEWKAEHTLPRSQPTGLEVAHCLIPYMYFPLQLGPIQTSFTLLPFSVGGGDFCPNIRKVQVSCMHLDTVYGWIVTLFV